MPVGFERPEPVSMVAKYVAAEQRGGRIRGRPRSGADGGGDRRDTLRLGHGKSTMGELRSRPATRAGGLPSSHGRCAGHPGEGTCPLTGVHPTWPVTAGGGGRLGRGHAEDVASHSRRSGRRSTVSSSPAGRGLRAWPCRAPCGRLRGRAAVAARRPHRSSPVPPAASMSRCT